MFFYRVMFPRGPEEWLGRICLTPLAKERQHVVMWPPSKMKVFSSKLKTGQKKKQCHTLNLDSFGYSHCSLCMQRNKNEADRLRVSGPAPAAWGDGVYNVFPNQLLQEILSPFLPWVRVIPQLTRCDTARSVLFQALCWEPTLLKGKLVYEM